MCGAGEFLQAHRLAEQVALSVLHADLDQELGDLVGLDEFAHGLDAEFFAQAGHGAQERGCVRLGQRLAHVDAVDLHVVDLQRTQVLERRRSGAEVVQAYKPTPESYLRTVDVLGMKPDAIPRVVVRPPVTMGDRRKNESINL